MADGGIHDQIGGGFCRYSVDERWEIPHFEKMLYDNAQLLPLYARAATAPMQPRAARELVAWLQREMTAPSGGFYARSMPTPNTRKASSTSGSAKKCARR